MNYELIHGKCEIEMKKLPDESADSCVTDPPYELGFMGKSWDRSGIAYNVDMWKEVFRVLKPGAHLLAFSSTRTYHRMACAIEDAGFEIRDQIGWLYGSGMPKSLNISKAIDNAAGAEREVIGQKTYADGKTRKSGGNETMHEGYQRPWRIDDPQKSERLTAPATDAAKQWDGWGTALKPAWEPICVARKPLAADTIAANVLAYGTGAINIDACRIEAEGASLARNNAPGDNGWKNSSGGKNAAAIREEQGLPAQGRWPANVIIDGSEEVLAEFAKYGERPNGGAVRNNQSRNGFLKGSNPSSMVGIKDTGSAARFFYSAKASQSERNAEGDNDHATVKPIALMEYLCKLVTQPNGVVLDPFAGSGSTGVGALRCKFRFIGIELLEAHYRIALRRLNEANRLVTGRPKVLTGHASDFDALPLFST